MLNKICVERERETERIASMFSKLSTFKYIHKICYSLYRYFVNLMEIYKWKIPREEGYEEQRERGVH